CWYGGHRALHSFPTRRSSDLGVVDGQLTSDGGDAEGECVAGGAVAAVAGAPPVTPVVGGTPRHLTVGVGECRRRVPAHGVWCWRSEEHTSELQSRENLVCRLL